MAKIVFLGRFKDMSAGPGEITLSNITTLSELIDQVAEGNPALHEALSHESTRIIVNKSVLVQDVLPAELDEIAFMPPLSGG